MAEIIVDIVDNLVETIGCEFKGELVRCKECKNNYNKVLNHGKMKPRCDFTDRVLTENDFCSRGEREGK